MRYICCLREIDITEECLEFIDSQNERVGLKFFQLIEVIGEIKVVNSNFLKNCSQPNCTNCELKQKIIQSYNLCDCPFEFRSMHKSSMLVRISEKRK